MCCQHLTQPQPLPAAVISHARCSISRAKQLQPRLGRHVGLSMRQLPSLVLGELLLRLLALLLLLG